MTSSHNNHMLSNINNTDNCVCVWIYRFLHNTKGIYPLLSLPHRVDHHENNDRKEWASHTDYARNKHRFYCMEQHSEDNSYICCRFSIKTQPVRVYVLPFGIIIINHIEAHRVERKTPLEWMCVELSSIPFWYTFSVLFWDLHIECGFDALCFCGVIRDGANAHRVKSFILGAYGWKTEA